MEMTPNEMVTLIETVRDRTEAETVTEARAAARLATLTLTDTVHVVTDERDEARAQLAKAHHEIGGHVVEVAKLKAALATATPTAVELARVTTELADVREMLRAEQATVATLTRRAELAEALTHPAAEQVVLRNGGTHTVVNLDADEARA